MQTSEGGLGYQELLWMLGSLCNLYRQPFAPELVSQQFPPPHHSVTLHEAARSLGFKTGTVSLTGIDWQRLPLPAIAFLTSVQIAGTNEIDVSARIPVLILEMGGKTWSVPCCFALNGVSGNDSLLGGARNDFLATQFKLPRSTWKTVEKSSPNVADAQSCKLTNDLPANDVRWRKRA